MEVEHIVAVVVAALVSLILLWVVWWFLCRSRDEDSDEEIGSPGKITNTHLITRDQSRRADGNLTDEDLSEDESNSRYILRPEALSDPFGVWSPKETLHSNPRSSYKTIYPKSPNLQRARKESGALYV